MKTMLLTLICILGLLNLVSAQAGQTVNNNVSCDIKVFVYCYDNNNLDCPPPLSLDAAGSVQGATGIVIYFPTASMCGPTVKHVYRICWDTPNCMECAADLFEPSNNCNYSGPVYLPACSECNISSPVPIDWSGGVINVGP